MDITTMVITTQRKIGVNAVTLRMLLRTKGKPVTEWVTAAILVTSRTVIAGEDQATGNQEQKTSPRIHAKERELKSETVYQKQA